MTNPLLWFSCFVDDLTESDGEEEIPEEEKTELHRDKFDLCNKKCLNALNYVLRTYISECFDTGEDAQPPSRQTGAITKYINLVKQVHLLHSGLCTHNIFTH